MNQIQKNIRNPNNNNNNDNCFQYAVRAALNHENIGKHPERISKISYQNHKTGKSLKITSDQSLSMFSLHHVLRKK